MAFDPWRRCLIGGGSLQAGLPRDLAKRQLGTDPYLIFSYQCFHEPNPSRILRVKVCIPGGAVPSGSLSNVWRWARMGNRQEGETGSSQDTRLTKSEHTLQEVK